MDSAVTGHYASGDSLADRVAERLQNQGKKLTELSTSDLAPVDEFHIRGRKATVELAQWLAPNADDHVLDIGSGLGGPARALAEIRSCRVTGIDLTPAYCEAAAIFSTWVGLDHLVDFQQADATVLPFEDNCFDAAMTIHVAMNIWAKDKVYAEARRVLKPGGRFVVYDVLQGEGGEVLYPVPWAREPSISHLATPTEMEALLDAAGFRIVEVHDSTTESQSWFEVMAAKMEKSGPPPLGFQLFLGDDFPEMARNQVCNLAQRRIRTVGFICEA